MNPIHDEGGTTRVDEPAHGYGNRGGGISRALLIKVFGDKKASTEATEIARQITRETFAEYPLGRDSQTASDQSVKGSDTAKLATAHSNHLPGSVTVSAETSAANDAAACANDNFSERSLEPGFTSKISGGC